MKKYFFTGLLFFVSFFVVITLSTASPYSDISGKWAGTLAGETEDSQPITVTFNFEQDENKLTGTISGGTDEWIPIKNGVIKGDNFSFKVDVDFNKTKMKFNYEGTIKEDEIHLIFTTEMAGWTGNSLPKNIIIKRVVE
jgi:hypothetical protein